MADENETQKAAAVCDNCGTAHAVRLGSDGEIRPIGTGQGPIAPVETGNFGS